MFAWFDEHEAIALVLGLVVTAVLSLLLLWWGGTLGPHEYIGWLTD